MAYERLADFVQNRMRMSHAYQPVMLMALLRGGGRRSTMEIAKSILAHDESQVEYYEKVTNTMVGRVLRNHGIVEKDESGYFLVGYEDLDGEQVERLVELCRSKLEEYKERRGRRIWQHRRVSSGYVSGTLRYEILKRARFRCELCGVSADVRALEVYHILPRNRGGADDPDNLQALCYSCNSMKRDRDATDFRKVRESYEHREPGCYKQRRDSRADCVPLPRSSDPSAQGRRGRSYGRSTQRGTGQGCLPMMRLSGMMRGLVEQAKNLSSRA